LLTAYYVVSVKKVKDVMFYYNLRHVTVS
jgi:hypothetical protein